MREDSLFTLQNKEKGWIVTHNYSMSNANLERTSAAKRTLFGGELYFILSLNEKGQGGFFSCLVGNSMIL